MGPDTSVWLALLIFLAATLYSSVGHAGASGYLAAMALFGLAPAVMKPAALCLNVLVAAIATVQFARAGCFSWRLFWPFAVASIPAAFVGGAITLPRQYYQPLVGLVLWFAAWRLWVGRGVLRNDESHPPPVGIGVGAGTGIGLLAGLTGTGGGIFLTPLMLLLGWAEPRRASGVSAAFILVNSISGLLGLLLHWKPLPSAIPIWAVCAVTGGLIGSHVGSRRLPSSTLRRVLSLVLVVAGAKLVASIR